MPISHFDIPAEDFKKMKQFYAGVFGWRFEKVQDPDEYWRIEFPSNVQSGPITGGMVQRSAPTQPIGCYFSVQSIDECSKKIEELGGTVFVTKSSVPGRGYYACCLDPENNYFVLWEVNEEAK